MSENEKIPPKKDTMGFYKNNRDEDKTEEGFLFSEAFDRSQKENLKEIYEKKLEITEQERLKKQNLRKAAPTYFVAGICVVCVSAVLAYVLFNLAGTKIYMLIPDIQGGDLEKKAFERFWAFWLFVAVIINVLLDLAYFKLSSALFNMSNIVFFSLFVLSYVLVILFLCLLSESSYFMIALLPSLAFCIIMNIKMSRKYKIYDTLKEMIIPLIQWRK